MKKPHSDINSTEMLIKVRERVHNKYREPLSDDVPEIWKYLVKIGLIYVYFIYHHVINVYLILFINVKKFPISHGT